MARYLEVRAENREWLILDTKESPLRIICRCAGWNAPKHSELICAALEAYNTALYSKFVMEVEAATNG